jgi:hypothetical protein
LYAMLLSTRVIGEPFGHFVNNTVRYIGVVHFFNGLGTSDELVSHAHRFSLTNYLFGLYCHQDP